MSAIKGVDRTSLTFKTSPPAEFPVTLYWVSVNTPGCKRRFSIQTWPCGCDIFFFHLSHCSGCYNVHAMVTLSLYIAVLPEDYHTSVME